MTKVFIGGDHAGFALKGQLIPHLKEAGYEVTDVGALELNPENDYPEYAQKVAESILQNPGSFGIIACGSGQGEAMVANRTKGIRAAVFYGEVPSRGVIDIEGTEATGPFDIVRLARSHNDANVLSIGARFISQEEAMQAVKVFLETPFSNDERHVRRIAKF